MMCEFTLNDKMYTLWYTFAGNETSWAKPDQHPAVKKKSLGKPADYAGVTPKASGRNSDCDEVKNHGNDVVHPPETVAIVGNAAARVKTI